MGEEGEGGCLNLIQGTYDFERQATCGEIG